MPKQQLALDPGGPKRLQITWKGFWKSFTVTLDGQELGTIPDKAALQAGRDFPLPDGSVLSIQLIQKPYQVELRVLRNGQPLPGSASDPSGKLKLAYGIIFFVAALNILLGVLAETTGSDFMKNVGMGIQSVIFGAIFLVLGVFVMKRSLVALIIAVALFALDAVAGFVLVVSAGGQPPIGGIIMRVFLLYGMAQAIPAIRALKVAHLAPPPVAYPYGGQGGAYGPGPGQPSPSGHTPGAVTPPSPQDPENPYRR